MRRTLSLLIVVFAFSVWGCTSEAQNEEVESANKPTTEAPSLENSEVASTESQPLQFPPGTSPERPSADDFASDEEREIFQKMEKNIIGLANYLIPNETSGSPYKHTIYFYQPEYQQTQYYSGEYFRKVVLYYSADQQVVTDILIVGMTCSNTGYARGIMVNLSGEYYRKTNLVYLSEDWVKSKPDHYCEEVRNQSPTLEQY